MAKLDATVSDRKKKSCVIDSNVVRTYDEGDPHSELLWLDPIQEDSRDRAIECLRIKDIYGCLCKMNSGVRLRFVFRNVALLQRLELYENALITAFIGVRYYYHTWPLYMLRCVFQLADRQRLRGAGDFLPGTAPFTVYRGVAGYGRARRVRGLSWTASPEIAWRFANQFPWLADPAVYKAVVREEDILAFTDKRKEQEFIVLPDNIKPVRLPAFDLKPQTDLSAQGEATG